MKKKRSVLCLLLCLLAFGALNVYANSTEDNVESIQQRSAAAYSFSQYLASNSVGYNVSIAEKNPGYDEAVVKVTYLDNNWPTNFLVIASDYQQISYNSIAPGIVPARVGMLYYNAAHAGNVLLRLNTGGPNYGYVVHGYWSPNWHSYQSIYDFLN